MARRPRLRTDDELRNMIYAAFGTTEAEIEALFGPSYLRAEAEFLAEQAAWRAYLTDGKLRMPNPNLVHQISHAWETMKRTPDPLKAVLKLHAPVLSGSQLTLTCLGCDQGCACDYAQWPCSTWKVANAKISCPGNDDA